MARTVLADTGFLIALLRQRDIHRDWAAARAAEFPPPWHTCEAVIAETFRLLSPRAGPALASLLQRQALAVSFYFVEHQEPVLSLMRKYVDVPMAFADACLVRMTEVFANPVVLTTDSHFRAYRRHSRQVVPCMLPQP
jgi:predicted nucleic acid-binding protein